jgi:hypothetical protein
LNYPGAGWTWANGISGSNIVGTYAVDNVINFQGFVYNGTSYTALNYPGAGWTQAWGISGSNIVGAYADSSGVYGFLCNGTDWTTLNYPGAYRTYARGISGNNVVGWYEDTSGNQHGFIYTIPEPATLLLLGLGAVMARRKRA